MTETILEAFPHLAPLARIHLSTDNGVPMHAEANGWYWYSDYDGHGTHLYPSQEPFYSMTPHQRAAEHLRISPAELPQGLNREQFAAFVATLAERWKADAVAALALLQTASVTG